MDVNNFVYTLEKFTVFNIHLLSLLVFKKLLDDDIIN